MGVVATTDWPVVVSVSVLDVCGLPTTAGVNDALTPAGTFSAASVMFPVNPPALLTVMPTVAACPCGAEAVVEANETPMLGVCPLFPAGATVLSPPLHAAMNRTVAIATSGCFNCVSIERNAPSEGIV
jgi:hypothetical protein